MTTYILSVAIAKTNVCQYLKKKCPQSLQETLNRILQNFQIILKKYVVGTTFILMSVAPNDNAIIHHGMFNNFGSSNILYYG